MTIPTPLQEEKRLLRQQMREKRAHSAKDPSSFSKLADIFQRNVTLQPGAIIASYAAFRDEMDTAVLCEALRRQGHPIALPVITAKREPLIFRLYEPGDQLLANPMGIFEPASTARNVDPDVILLPLLAFDKNRNRLGYGGGYYDRTLNSLRTRKHVTTIGIAYSFQEVAAVPTGPHDIKLDKIATELTVL